jgi:hypothetical protein
MEFKIIIAVLLGATLLFGCLGGGSQPTPAPTTQPTIEATPTTSPSTAASAVPSNDLPPLPPEVNEADQAQSDLDQSGQLLDDVPPIPDDQID